MNPSREVIDRSERQPHTDFRTTHYIDAPARSHTSISSLADDLAANLLTRDEAQHIAANIARLPPDIGRAAISERPENITRVLLRFRFWSNISSWSTEG